MYLFILTSDECYGTIINYQVRLAFLPVRTLMRNPYFFLFRVLAFFGDQYI